MIDEFSLSFPLFLNTSSPVNSGLFWDSNLVLSYVFEWSMEGSSDVKSLCRLKDFSCLRLNFVRSSFVRSRKSWKSSGVFGMPRDVNYYIRIIGKFSRGRQKSLIQLKPENHLNIVYKTPKIFFKSPFNIFSHFCISQIIE